MEINWNILELFWGYLLSEIIYRKWKVYGDYMEHINGKLDVYGIYPGND